nr:reverse transcriptase domain-containing protein [Tanacetum cinerariifolium]
MSSDDTSSAALEQASPSLKYVPDLMGLEDHAPMYVLEPEYLEYLAPSDDDIPMEDQPLPVDALPVALSLGYIADTDLEEDEEDPEENPADGGDDNDEEEEEESSEDEEEDELLLTPPLLPIPLPTPSTSRIADISEADIPFQKRLLLTTPTRSIRSTKRRTMAAIEVVNLREDRAAVRAKIEVLRRERLAYEQESILETQAHRHEWQRQDAYDRATGHIMCIQALEAGARIGTLEDTGVADALAAIEANRTSRNGDDKHDSGTGSRRTKSCWSYSVGIALTRWNSHVKTGTHYVAYAMTWKTLKKMMTDKYCPRDEIKKLEVEMWNLKVKGTDVAYTASPGDKKPYRGSKPLCPKCNYHHDGQCAPKCTNCKRTGHLARDSRSHPAAANNN